MSKEPEPIYFDIDEEMHRRQEEDERYPNDLDEWEDLGMYMERGFND